MSQETGQADAHHNPGELLVRMANDIGNFFRAEPDREEAVTGIANHIARYWSKRMRQKLAAYGEQGLDELPRDALRRLAANNGSALSKEPPGGDAG